MAACWPTAAIVAGSLDSARLNKVAIEPELALVLGADLPAGVDPHSADSVAAAVAEVVPALEIVDSLRRLDEVGLPRWSPTMASPPRIKGTARPLAPT